MPEAGFIFPAMQIQGIEQGAALCLFFRQIISRIFCSVETGINKHINLK